MYLINFNQKKFLIEIGYNWNLNRGDFTNLKGVFITHNHSDHIGYLKSFVKNFPSTKIYLTNGTFKEWTKKVDPLAIKLINKRIVEYGKYYEVDEDLEIFIDQSFHDTPEPCFFIFFDKKTGETLIFITDTGKLPVLPKIKNIEKTYVLLEANYDPKMMMSNSIKDLRSSSDEGHLSINAAKKFVKEFKDAKFIGLIHGSTTKLNKNSDNVFKNYKNVIRINSGWEGEFE